MEVQPARRERGAEPCTSSHKSAPPKKKKKKQDLRGSVKSSVDRDIFNDIQDTEEKDEPETLKMRREFERKDTKIMQLRAARNNYLKLNHDLQRALCAKVFAKALPRPAAMEQVAAPAASAVVNGAVARSAAAQAAAASARVAVVNRALPGPAPVVAAVPLVSAPTVLPMDDDELPVADHADAGGTVGPYCLRLAEHDS
ncbi:unnamed protein product [Ixodes pacificus]